MASGSPLVSLCSSVLRQTVGSNENKGPSDRTLSRENFTGEIWTVPGEARLSHILCGDLGRKFESSNLNKKEKEKEQSLSYYSCIYSRNPG